MIPIRRLLLLSLFALALSIPSHAQSGNCSYGSYNLTGSTYNEPPCNDPPATITASATYALSCTTAYGNSTPGTTYWTATSTVTGTGQNYCALFNSTKCPPVMQFQETNGTSYPDYNRFYNRAYNYVVSGAYCTQNGYNQDFKQCSTAPCDATCSPSGSPPYGGNSVCWSWDTNSCSWVQVTCNSSPILIDVSGNGFQLTSAAGGVSYDITGNGTPVQIAWTAPGAQNAFLCLPDAYGYCDTGKQLFGNFTPQPASSTPNGFAALAVYDNPANGGNGDSIIDSHDAIFSRLRLWIDANHDGISQPDELYALPSLGVNSISLSYKLNQRTDQYGNQFRYFAQINPGGPTGGAGRMAYDVFLVTQTTTTSAKRACSVPAKKTGGK